MYKCDICGRELHKKISLYGYILCSKHMHQYLKYGEFKDNIQRTNSDLNDYVIDYDTRTVTFNIYNQKNVKNGEFIVDLDDIELVKYHKWRLNHAHVCTGVPAYGTQRDLSHVILGITKQQCQGGVVVDHINGNAFDNRRCNLRVCKQSQNVLNKSFMSNNTSGFIGVTYRKDRDRYDPEIRFGKTRCHLGYTRTLEEAVYKRYVAESYIFGEYANELEHDKKQEITKNLSKEKKAELAFIVWQKLKNKGLWQ